MIRLRRIWAFLSTVFAGIIFRFEFEKPLDKSKTYVICGNHASNLDTAMMSLLLGDNCCFMGKQELLEDMITGIFFRTVDIPVNRDSKMSSFKAFKAAAEKLKNGIHMIMFPEGGIADAYPPRLQEFKNGPFRLAIETKTPVLPVTSLNSWKMVWDNGAKYGTKPGICRVFVHGPIDTANLTAGDADWLKDKVHGIISNKWAQALASPL